MKKGDKITIMDKETGESVHFKRLSNRKVEIISDDDEILQTLSNSDFDKLIVDGNFSVL